MMTVQVLVYGDCAVNVEPGAEELALIAVTSAETAAAFGVTPRVAMLSYSTGVSGAGPQVTIPRPPPPPAPAGQPFKFHDLTHSVHVCCLPQRHLHKQHKT